MKNTKIIINDLMVAFVVTLCIIVGLVLIFSNYKNKYELPSKGVSFFITPKPTEPPPSPVGSIKEGLQTKQVTIKTDTYTIQAGDTLWDIAEKAYGDPYLWPKIFNANSIQNPDLIYSGDKLVIPRS